MPLCLPLSRTMSHTDERSALLSWRQIEQDYPVLRGYGYQLHRWVADGRFPAPVRLNQRVLRYRRADVERWLALRTLPT